MASELNEVQRRRMLVRVVAASAIGTTIEWYDFFLYGAVAALVFPRLFFPGSDAFVGTLLSFSTYFVGFAARPIGAAIFGHYGDRLGRKTLLITTMVMMGISTMGIGLVPSYASIGSWGAVLLTFGRLIQGISVGGEWSGSVLMAGEWADPKRRGFTTSFAQVGAPAGMVLANGTLAVMTVMLDEKAFLSWGWRVPFLASFVLIMVGLWIRIGVLESPVFQKLKQQGRVVKTPVVQVLKHHWREVALTALLRTGQHVPFYIFTTYILVYGTQALGLARSVVLNLVMIQSIASMMTIPVMGHLSDRYGRRKIIAIGCAAMIVWPFFYFWMTDSKIMGLVAAAIILGLPIQDLQYGPQAAFISESFPGSVRYSGSALGYQLASITAGGPAPIVATILYERYHSSLPIAVYISISAAISLICVWVLKDRTGMLDNK
jgi:metabolite-proton symporter